MKIKFLFSASLIVAMLAVSCKKENNTVPVQLLLTDNPTALDEVNVEILAMEVKVSKDTTKWYSIVTKPGVYNLLALQNGVTSILADGNVPDAVLKEIRFTLGTHNTVKANGQTYALQAPDKDDSGLKVKIDKQLSQTLNAFTLDFDAALSVKAESAGVYKLQPVIKWKQ